MYSSSKFLLSSLFITSIFPAALRSWHGFVCSCLLLTCLLQSRTFAGLEIKEWAFLVVSMINLLVTLALTIYRQVVVISHEHTEEPDFTFCILIIVNAGF